MKLMSFNVNGLRACMKNGFMEMLKKEDPDIIGIQETKMQPIQADFSFPGYYSYWNSAERKGYSGTLVLSRIEPINVHYGLKNGSHNDEGRVITLEFDDFYFITMYTPNSKEGLIRIPYRVEFEEALREYLKELKSRKHVILCGDLNVAHNEIDLVNASSHHFDPGFSDEERHEFCELLKMGFVDTYRFLHPERKKYSWWSYRQASRERNIGWRIDYFIVDKDFLEKVIDSDIRNDIYGSDHCPVELLIGLNL